jgi:hypothetical protein
MPYILYYITICWALVYSGGSNPKKDEKLTKNELATQGCFIGFVDANNRENGQVGIKYLMSRVADGPVNHWLKIISICQFQNYV